MSFDIDIDKKIKESGSKQFKLWWLTNNARKHIARKRAGTVIEMLSPKKNEKVLDVGCGWGFAALMLSKYSVMTIGVDRVVAHLKTAKEIAEKNSFNAKFVAGDALALPFKDGVFDKNMSMEMLEHIPNWKASLFELARVLKPEGTLVVSTPNRISPVPNFRALLIKYKLLKRPPIHDKPIFPLRITKALREIGMNCVKIRFGNGTLPQTPDKMLKMVQVFEKILERIPVIRWFLINLYVSADKKRAHDEKLQ